MKDIKKISAIRQFIVFGSLGLTAFGANGLDNSEADKTWSDGTQYIGGLVNDKREGEGTIIWTSGAKFDGRFENDLREGEGRLTLPDGRSFVAMFKQDVIVSDSIAQRTGLTDGTPDVDQFLQEMNRQLDVEIRAEVDNWKAAWASQNLTEYLSYYSTDFEPTDGASMNTWRQNRAVRVRRPNKIELSVSDVVVDLETQTRAKVTFLQEYESDLYKDRVNKQLSFRRELGGWKIVAESVVIR